MISCRTGLQDYSCHMAQSRDPSPEALLENRPARGQQYAVHGDRDAVRPSQAHPASRSAQVERSVGSQGEFLFDATGSELRKLAKLLAPRLRQLSAARQDLR